MVFVEKLTPATALPAGFDECIVWSLDVEDAPASGATSVFDLLQREVHGERSAHQDATREFLRQRGVRFPPGPWRYRGGLI